MLLGTGLAQSRSGLTTRLFLVRLSVNEIGASHTSQATWVRVSRSSKCGPQTGSISFSITRDLVGNALFQAPPQTPYRRDGARGATCASLPLQVTASLCPGRPTSPRGAWIRRWGVRVLRGSPGHPLGGHVGSRSPPRPLSLGFKRRRRLPVKVVRVLSSVSGCWTLWYPTRAPAARAAYGNSLGGGGAAGAGPPGL